MRKIGYTTVMLLCLTLAWGGEKFEYNDLRSGRLSSRGVSGIRSLADGEHFTTIKGGVIERSGYADGLVLDTLFDSSKTSIKNLRSYEFSASEQKLLLTTNSKAIYRHSFTADHFVWGVKSGVLTPISESGGEQVATMSPDESRVAFVRDNNLWLTDLSSGKITQVTTDGERNKIINGHTDWVYEEEFSFAKAYEFSPDGKKIGYVRFDESRVPEYSMTIYGIDLYPTQYVYKYPKAGEANSVVSLHIYDIESGKTVRIDVGDDLQQYIPLIGWTPSGTLYFCRINRLQNSYQLMLSDDKGNSRAIYSEKNPRYIERLNKESITFLPDGKRFIIKNESSGFSHLYLYDIEKGLVGAVTKGGWEVGKIVEITPNKIYYMGNEGSPLRNNLYSVEFSGKNKTRITSDEGNYSIAPSRGMKYYISTFTNVNTPPIVTLNRGNGKQIRVMEDNKNLRGVLNTMDLPIKEFFQFTTERGDKLNGYIVKPKGFDTNGNYPVMMYQYSGPGSQSVVDRWGIDWLDVMVGKGYVLVCVDGRGTGGCGEEFRKCTYADLGNKEVEDQISAARWVAAQPWSDPARIGMYGWSYGGFMALGCILKGNDVFKMAIAVAPVTSWRFYDSVYTEMYNGLPSDNPKGYDDNSPLNFADRLRGKLLLIHGSSDDNVHVQNTYRMASELTKANKRFDMAIYPDDNHSMVPTGQHHIKERMIDYTLENL